MKLHNNIFDRMSIQLRTSLTATRVDESPAVTPADGRSDLFNAANELLSASSSEPECASYSRQRVFSVI